MAGPEEIRILKISKESLDAFSDELKECLQTDDTGKKVEYDEQTTLSVNQNIRESHDEMEKLMSDLINSLTEEADRIKRISLSFDESDKQMAQMMKSRGEPG